MAISTPLSREITQSPCTYFSKAKLLIVRVVIAIFSIVLIVLGALSFLGISSMGMLICGAILLGCLIAELVLLASTLLAVSILKKIRVKQEEIPAPPPHKDKPPLPKHSTEVDMLPWALDLLRKARIKDRPLPSDPEEAALEYATRELVLRDTAPDRIMPHIPSSLKADVAYLQILTERKYQVIQRFLCIDEENKCDYPTDPEKKQKFYRLATEYIYLAYATGQRTLSVAPLPILSEREACFLTSRAYRFLRFLHENSRKNLDAVTEKSIVAQFYIEGTPEYKWRGLYNSYCHKIHLIISNRQQEAIVEATEEPLLSCSYTDYSPNFKKA
ncbi:hypothetical protein [Chlamydia vaughanii]|uniref:hypothetical protein n=1 Tax=Chlamydia vaughanii TaxID=3112552 RepID=UPI0032B2CBCF